MNKMRWIILAMVAIIGLGGCVLAGTIRLDSPMVIGSTASDAIPIYVEPYRVHDSFAPLGTPVEWDRDVYIKQAIAVRMKARFVDSPATARIAITTTTFEIGHVGAVHCSSATKINGLTVKTYIKRPSQFFHGVRDGYLDLARGDAEIVSAALDKILLGDVVHEATGVLEIGDKETYRGLIEIKIK